MAAAGAYQRRELKRGRPLAFWLASAAAAVLSLAAALAGLLPESNEGAGPDAASEMALRSQRIAFFEARAEADHLDFVSLNTLAGEYLQHSRETNDIADYERAETAATRSLQIVSQDNLNAVVALGSLRTIQHDFKAAWALAEQAIAIKPGSASGYGIKGDALFNLGRYDEAAAEYEKMVNIEASVASLSRLAALTFVRGDTLNALDYWRQAIVAARGASAENLAWAYSQRGGVHFALGDLKRAESVYNASLKAFPGYAASLAGLGQVRAAQTRWDDAVGLYLKAVERQPQPQYVAALGDVYTAMGDGARAQEQYELVEAIDALYRAGGINTDLALARFYLDHGRETARALQMARAAYKESPNLQAAGVYAWALYQAGERTEARMRIDEALRLGTLDASLHYYAAKIAHALGDAASARAHIDRALELNPHFSLVLADDARNLQTELRDAR